MSRRRNRAPDELDQRIRDLDAERLRPVAGRFTHRAHDDDFNALTRQAELALELAEMADEGDDDGA